MTVLVICRRKHWPPDPTKSAREEGRYLVSPKDGTVIGGIDVEGQASSHFSVQ